MGMKSCLHTMALVFLLAAVGLPGCGSKSDPGANSNVTKSNLVKIKPDMSVSDVQAILGTGEVVREGFAKVNNQRVPDEERTWSNGTRVITVSFVNGKVVYATGVNL
jgi:hypothetical protein